MYEFFSSYEPVRKQFEFKYIYLHKEVGSNSINLFCLFQTLVVAVLRFPKLNIDVIFDNYKHLPFIQKHISKCEICSHCRRRVPLKHAPSIS